MNHSLNNTAAKHTRQVEQTRQLIEQLDLDPIKVKIMDKEEGLGWTRRQVDEVEKFYRQFLFLNAKYRDRSIVPNKAIDQFWHFHILDTMKYEQDCAEVFGYFLHHFPYFGMRGEKDAENLRNAFSVTCDLFEMEFGETPKVLVALFGELANHSNVCESPNCYGSGCVGSKCGGEPPEPSEGRRITVIRDNSRPSLN